MSSSQVRSKDQLAVLLKLIDVNKPGLKHKNANVRQRIWQVITQKLNQMQGAEKDVDGWKRCYSFFRSHAGDNFERDVQKIIQNVADDEYYVINAMEDEFARNQEEQPEANYLDAKDEQATRLHELITKNRPVLQSTSNDEPLKECVWKNIAKELNSMQGGLKLSVSQWKQRVDWSHYAIRRGRKRKMVNTTVEIQKHQESQDAKNVACEVIIEETQDCETYDALSIEELDVGNEKSISIVEIPNDSSDDIDKHLNDYENSENNLNDFDDNEDGYKDSLTPIVQSFKLSNRITVAVEELNTEVKGTKQLLKENAAVMAKMCKLIQKQCDKQDETNAILKHNNKLLEMLVKSKYQLNGNKN